MTSILVVGCSMQMALALAGGLLAEANHAGNSAAADWQAFKLVLARRLAASPQARPRLVALTVRASAFQRSTASAMMDRDAA